MPLTVTFDTNTLASVVSPDITGAQRGTGPSGATVRTAIQAGQIQGFFSETLITLEGIEDKDRAQVLGKTEVIHESSSAGKNITLTVGVRHTRNPFDPRFTTRVQQALALGMLPLRTAARIGGFHIMAPNYPIFEPTGGILELVRCMDNVNEMTTEIARRGVGEAVAVKLGLEFGNRRKDESKPELWLRGLRLAHNKSERTKVAMAIREWADGDSVAAHYGFGIDLFCSDDCGKTAAGPSVLDCNNRRWLREDFGVQFVRLDDLAKRVMALRSSG